VHFLYILPLGYLVNAVLLRKYKKLHEVDFYPILNFMCAKGVFLACVLERGVMETNFV